MLAKVLKDGFLHDGSYSSFRAGTTAGPSTPSLVHPAALVVCNQNHDQIGNRATGDRLSQSLSYGQLALAAVLTLTSPFTPMLFMGEEFGATTPWQFFTSHPEPELGKATAEGRIKEFERMGWDPAVVPDPQDPETFTRSKLDWAEAGDGDHARLLELYRSLTALRREYAGTRRPGFAETDVDVRRRRGLAGVPARQRRGAAELLRRECGWTPSAGHPAAGHRRSAAGRRLAGAARRGAPPS